MRDYSCVVKLTESEEIPITIFPITCCTEQTEIPYRTAEYYSYVNTAAVNPTTTLTVHS